MDIEYECSFIRNSINKSRIDRVCYELSLEEKRERALTRFHNPNEIVNMAKTVDVTKLQPEEMFKYIKKNIKANKCYILSFDSALDGKTFELSEDILIKCFDDGFPLIMIFDAENGLIFGEQFYGPAEKLLINNKNL